jgi:hypothetical protein
MDVEHLYIHIVQYLRAEVDLELEINETCSHWRNTSIPSSHNKGRRKSQQGRGCFQWKSRCCDNIHNPLIISILMPSHPPNSRVKHKRHTHMHHVIGCPRSFLKLLIRLQDDVIKKQ